MTATIEIAGTRATIDGWEWTGPNEMVVALLNGMLDPIGPSGADPAPDYHGALAAVKELGGKVTEYELPEYVEGRVY